MISFEEFLDTPIGISPSSQAYLTTKKSYRNDYRFINVTSYSQREVLHECPRKFQQLKIVRAGAEQEETSNVDFIFGHAVGAGVQNYIVNEDKNFALYTTFLAWKADLETVLPKKQKSFLFAYLAVLKFIDVWDQIKDTWTIAVFNERPASELLFWIDCENGYFHVGHIDVIIQNRITKELKIVEIKTTSSRYPDEAAYGNSDQALGYSIVLDAIAKHTIQISTFNVLYYVYSTTSRNWSVFQFTKNRSQRADWLQDLLLDHSTIETYRKLRLFPKRGNSCWTFSRRCPHYGICDLKDSTRNDSFHTWTLENGYSENPDFIFKLSELISGIRYSTTTVSSEE
jgi:hypothetical protein